MDNKKILIVDDEPFILKSLLFIFRKEGYDVKSAISGEEALSLLREERPALLFLDIMLPGRDGYDICREIKEDVDLRSTHVVLLTAKGQERDKEKAFAVGADEYVTKPFSPSRMIELARSFFESAPVPGD
jgi:two-component system alkaline phosphatase synthesis response regulator PhoP